MAVIGQIKKSSVISSLSISMDTITNIAFATNRIIAPWITTTTATPRFLYPHTSKRPIPILSLFFRNPNFNTSRSSMATSLQVNASSTVDATNDELEASSSGMVGANDLMIVGPGVLGRLVAEKWREEHPGCQILGQTFTTDHHDELIKVGINPSLKGTQVNHKFPYVIFCAPPSRTSDYPGEVREAALNWSGEGSFLFTSSSALYDCNDNGSCDEDSPVVPIGRSPRTDVLLKAEKVVLESGGCVVRLAGLYKEDRGAHTYWLGKGIVEARPDHILNLIHYEDAASLSVAILKKKLKGRIFMGCDNHPLSRQEVMDLVEKSGKFSKKFEAFMGTNDPLGKKLNNSKTRKEIDWEPKYPSFSQFLGVSE
ncbi:uncharacterized protein LOC132294922 isoform X2 [Cornus florida]|uniref:uncharacterized protein LOC132294922 isoform X2 n=1 Tax=Cornus florida TaxID=4283 RepID=UPI00289ACCCC|nr:uncharacterized protein LOC132294922 isoform X2 [Cornus florida]